MMILICYYTPPQSVNHVIITCQFTSGLCIQLYSNFIQNNYRRVLFNLIDHLSLIKTNLTLDKSVSNLLKTDF